MGPPAQGPLAILKGAATVGVGPSEGRAADGSKISPCGPVVLLGGNLGPCQAQPHDRGLPLKFCSPAHLACFGCNLEMEFLKCREKDERRKQQPESQSSMTDCALLEEASRYGSDLNSWGLRVSGPFHSSPFSFG